VVINGGKLVVGTVANLAEVTTLFGHVAKGELVVTTAPATTKPSDIITAFSGTTTTNKKLTITATANESDTTPTIPAWLNLTLASTDTLATVTALTVQGTLNLSGAVAPTAGDVTVGANGAINVSGTSSLTIAADKTLANDGTVALTDTGSVKLLAAATQSDGGAKITGAGTLTAQYLEIKGGAGGWQALVDADGQATSDVTIASTATDGQATITGLAATPVSLKGGADATITQKAGTTSNKLTLTTVTIDVSTAGSITLNGAATDGAKLEMVAATAIISGAGISTKTAKAEANVTQIGSIAADNYVLTDNVEFTGDTGEAFKSIKGAGSANTLTAGTANITLDKNTAVVGTFT
jgi:hypothetical protein